MSLVIQSRMPDGTLEKRYFLDDGKCWLWERYREDKLEECKQWDANGTPIDHRFYKNGKIQGSITWYADGLPCSWMFYANETSSGESRRWARDGTIQFHTYYQGGTIDSKFSLKKKLSALYMKKYLRIRPPIINDYLISDLSKMVSG